MPAFPPVLIIAGGLGTRIQAEYPNLPKSLVPVNGEPFVVHQLRLLKRENVTDVIFCVGHLSKQLVDFVRDGARFGLRVRYSHDGDQLLGTGGSVLKASQPLGSHFAVLYGDSYLDTTFANVYQTFLNSGKRGLMTVYRNENRLIPSNMRVEDRLVTAYDKKNPAPDMVYCDYGLSIFNKSAFAGFHGGAFDLSEVTAKLIDQRELAALEMSHRFYEIGSPEGIKDLAQYLKEKAAEQSDSASSPSMLI